MIEAVTYEDLFLNIAPPSPGTDEYYARIDTEVNRITNGITIDGVFISAWLYWHTNHWHLGIDQIDGSKKYLHPVLRDNEWIRGTFLHSCVMEKLGYFEVGGRQSAKSEMEASFSALSSILKENTQNLIVGNNATDINLITAKIDAGLTRLWEGINIPRLDKTWRGSAIRLGFKTSTGEDRVWSTIMIRNTDGGNNTEVAAGTTASSFIMDEVAKEDFLAALAAAKPAIKGRFGYRAIPMLVATGGNAAKSGDAETLYFNPESYDFKAVIHEDGTKTCLFLSGIYRQEFKETSTLYDYLISTGEITPETVLNNGENLKKIVMWVSDVEKATATIKAEREKLKASADSLSYLKEIMYSPLHVHECFLSEKSGLFNQETARRQRLRLIEQGRIGTYVELYEEEGQVKHKFTDKLPIYNYPIQKNESKDAPVVIYEFPVEDSPHGLYVAGVDSYRMAQSDSSNSLGSVYIFKRMHSLLGEKYQDMLVASYVARPEDKEHWNEQALFLIQYYNARTLVENDEISFIDYVISKNKSKYLEYQPEWIKAVDVNSRVKRPFGVSRSNEKIRDYLHGLVNRYMNEVMNIQKDENGIEISRTTGEIRILDIPLLQEIEKCDGKINVDRVIAFELALAMAYNLNPIYEDSIGKQRGSADHTIKRAPLFARTASVFPKNKLRF